MESLSACYYINMDKMQFNDTNLQKEAQTAVETLLQIDFFQFSRILETIVILVVLIILRYVLLRIIYRRTNDSVILYKWRKRLAYIGSFIGFLLIGRSEEHTSELQSRGHLVCRLLLEKKKKSLSKRSYTNDN